MSNDLRNEMEFANVLMCKSIRVNEIENARLNRYLSKLFSNHEGVEFA